MHAIHLSETFYVMVRYLTLRYIAAGYVSLHYRFTVQYGMLQFLTFHHLRMENRQYVKNRIAVYLLRSSRKESYVHVAFIT